MVVQKRKEHIKKGFIFETGGLDSDMKLKKKNGPFPNSIFPPPCLTWTRGHDGCSMCASALAASAPLRKVGPRLMVMLENQIMNRPKETHCGLSFRRERVSSESSSGRMGASLRTVVRRLTVETVTRRRKVVSTSAHLLMASQRKMDLPMGSRMAALAQSTTAWWKISPWLHLTHDMSLSPQVRHSRTSSMVA